MLVTPFQQGQSKRSSTVLPEKREISDLKQDSFGTALFERGNPYPALDFQDVPGIWDEIGYPGPRFMDNRHLGPIPRPLRRTGETERLPS